MEKLDGSPGMQVTTSCVCNGNQATEQGAPGGPRWLQVAPGGPRCHSSHVGKELGLEAQDLHS